MSIRDHEALGSENDDAAVYSSGKGKPELKSVRGTRVALVFLGAMLVYWGISLPHPLIFVAPLVTGADVPHCIFGVLISIFGLLTLFRHKGDYVDFDEVDGKENDGSQKRSANTKW